METKVTYLNVSRLARRAGTHRPAVHRLLAQGLLIPDAYGEFGGGRQPLFLPIRVDEVLRGILPAKRL